MTSPPAVELKQIKKYFGGVKALDGVDFSMRRGSIHALLGANGAGKSTLMKVLSGIYSSDSGEIFLNGKSVQFHSPEEASRAGISIIHQELSVFPELTVAENFFLGRWVKRRGVIDWTEMHQQAQRWISEVGAHCQPTDRMSDLSVGTQQLIEIAKALFQNREFLILDEPTSALTPAEVKKLFGFMNALKFQGKALVFISHRFDEVFEISDEVTVLKDGKTVFYAPLEKVTEKQLIEYMIGHQSEQESSNVKNDVATATDFSNTTPLWKFNLKPGEILGFAGLLGAGRSELLRAEISTPREALKKRIVYLSEDRKRESIFPGRSLTENVGITRLSLKSVFRGFRPEREKDLAQTALQRLNTKFDQSDQPISSLSGGNQQKVVLARLLETNPDLLILDEPTRGIDMGAKQEIYELLRELKRQGKGLIVISSETTELMELCDRIIVLYEGQVSQELKRSEFSKEAILHAAFGRSSGREAG